MQAGLQADQGPAVGMDARVVFDAIAAHKAAVKITPVEKKWDDEGIEKLLKSYFQINESLAIRGPCEQITRGKTGGQLQSAVMTFAFNSKGSSTRVRCRWKRLAKSGGRDLQFTRRLVTRTSGRASGSRSKTPCHNRDCQKWGHHKGAECSHRAAECRNPPAPGVQREGDAGFISRPPQISNGGRGNNRIEGSRRAVAAAKSVQRGEQGSYVWLSQPEIEARDAWQAAHP